MLYLLVFLYDIMPNTKQWTTTQSIQEEGQGDFIPENIQWYVDNRWLLGIMLIIIIEVATPLGIVFPTDAIVFGWGMYFATKGYSIWLIMGLFSVAVILWDVLGYRRGTLMSHKISTMEDTRYFKRKYITICERYFDDYGKKTMIISKFLPIRSMIPLVSGALRRPNWGTFIVESILSAILWIISLLWASYFIIRLIPAAANHIALLTFLFVVIPQIISVWYMVLPAMKKYEAKLWQTKDNFQHIAQEVGMIGQQFANIGGELKEIYHKVIDTNEQISPPSQDQNNLAEPSQQSMWTLSWDVPVSTISQDVIVQNPQHDSWIQPNPEDTVVWPVS